MKLKLTTLALLLFFQNLAAQKNEFFISLQSQVLKVENFNFRVAEVFDGREETYSIGFVQRGGGNSKAIARLQGGVEKEFSNLFSNSFPANKDAKPISIRVNQLEIYEFTTANREVAGIEFNLSFLEKQTSGGYIELYNAGQFFEKAGLDVTKKHNNNIAEATENACKIFVERCGKGNFWNRPFDLKITPDSLFQLYPVLQATQPKAGIYKSFEDFRDNSPNTDHPFELTEVPTKTKRNWIGTAKWVENQQRIEYEKYWGLSDGQDVYIKSGDIFIKLERKNRQFSLTSKTFNDNGNGGAVVGAMYGGLIGALIGAAIDAAADGNGEYEPYFLNLQTGSFSPEKNRKKKKAEARAVIFCNKTKSEVPPTAQLTLGGKPIGNFKPNEAYKIHIPIPAGDMEICMDNGGEKTCKTFNFKPYQTTYLEVNFRKDKFSIGRVPDDYLEWLKSDLEKGKITLTEKDW